LLAENRARDPEYGGGLSNHLPMSLVALAELGADDDRLAAFARTGARRLEPLRPLGEPIAWSAWSRAIGKDDALGGLLGAFDRRLRERGRTEVLAEVLPRLVPALGAQLFHGIIRCAYALRVDDDEELAHGLAYWASAAVPLRPLAPVVATPRPAAELLREALASRDLGGAIDSGPSMMRMRTASARPGFDALIAGYDPGEDDRPALAELARDVWRGTSSFIALHLVTGTQALGVLWPHLADRRAALRWHWQGLLAATLTFDPPAPVDAPAPAASWSELHARAIGRDDDHDVKLVDACTQERTASADAAWRHAAALRLGLA
jgi:hypothetical protein